MNRKQLLTLLVLVAVIGGAGLLVNKQRQGDWQKSSTGGGQKLAGALDVNAVATVSIKSSAGELNLTKQGEAWVVKERGDYAANFSTIADLIRDPYVFAFTGLAEQLSKRLISFDRLTPNPKA